MAKKVFKVRRNPKPNLEFDLVYEVDTPEPGEDADKERVETFHAIPEVPGAILLDVAASMVGEDGEKAKAIRMFLKTVIVDGEKEQFEKIINASVSVIDMKVLVEIVEWLMEQYSDRPTESA